MSSIDKITGTTLMGLNIGVLAGVSGGVIKNINKLFGGTTKKRRRTKRR
jgi:hypothetical protein